MPNRYKVLILNQIAVSGLERLPRERYEVGTEIANPDAILLRSADMRVREIPCRLKAVGRAGVGVNNIPVETLSARGVPVFNAPGANANAVKELVLAGLFLCARDVCNAWRFAVELSERTADDAQLAVETEAGKKSFVGFELPGRTLGVIGLGAIGVRVANAARALGMQVIGYDPAMTVTRAWQLSSEVAQAQSIDELLRKSHIVTVHVPYSEHTRDLINAERIRALGSGACLLNFSRKGIVNQSAVLEALSEGRLHRYVSDFPSRNLVGHPGAIVLPHIGASTREAEENCATMAAEAVRAFLEEGSVTNSVNFPDASMPRNGGYRVAVVNRNVPNMLGQISTTLAEYDINILDMLNRSRGELAYTLLDAEQAVGEPVLSALRAIEGVLSVRSL